jgi:hypothetical protein
MIKRDQTHCTHVKREKLSHVAAGWLLMLACSLFGLALIAHKSDQRHVDSNRVEAREQEK